MAEKLVRYISPFGSPAWMPRERALKLLEEDDARWLKYQRLGMLSDEQRASGGPRIEVVS